VEVGCPPARDFENDASGIAQFLKPYQKDARLLQRIKKEREEYEAKDEQERARLLQEQQMRAEKVKKDREEMEAKAEQEPASMALELIRDCKRDGSTILYVRWPSLSSFLLARNELNSNIINVSNAFIGFILSAFHRTIIELVSSPPFFFSLRTTSCSRCQRRLVSSPTSNSCGCDVIV